MYRRRGGAPKPYMKISRKKVLYQKYPKNTPFKIPDFTIFPCLCFEKDFAGGVRYIVWKILLWTVTLRAQTYKSGIFEVRYVNKNWFSSYLRFSPRKQPKMLKRCVFGLPLHPELFSSKSSCRVSGLHPFVYTWRFLKFKDFELTIKERKIFTVR